MKIISKVDITTWAYEFNCYTCQSKLCADYTDLKYRIEQKWSGGCYGDDGSYYNADYFYVICPVCQKEHDVATATVMAGVRIPYLLQQKVKKDYNENHKPSRHK